MQKSVGHVYCRCAVVKRSTNVDTSRLPTMSVIDVLFLLLLSVFTNTGSLFYPTTIGFRFLSARLST
jgi:hypothetical protein